MNNPIIGSFEEWASSIIYNGNSIPLLMPNEDWLSWANRLRRLPKYENCPSPSGDDWRRWATEVYRFVD